MITRDGSPATHLAMTQTAEVLRSIKIYRHRHAHSEVVQLLAFNQGAVVQVLAEKPNGQETQVGVESYGRRSAAFVARYAAMIRLAAEEAARLEGVDLVDEVRVGHQHVRSETESRREIRLRADVQGTIHEVLIVHERYGTGEWMRPVIDWKSLAVRTDAQGALTLSSILAYAAGLALSLQEEQ